MSKSSAYQSLPSINECDKFLEEQGLSHGKVVRNLVNAVLSQVRQEIVTQENATQEIAPQKSQNIPQEKKRVLEKIAVQVRIQTQGVQPVINATGVVIHTNLGRAPLSESLFQKVMPRLCAYSTLEFDLASGKRGSRDSQIRKLLCTLSGAEDALAVNNNAAAVFLMLKSLTSGNAEEDADKAADLEAMFWDDTSEAEVIVSRGELVEIGGSFRIPDIMREAGVKLIEVGTTNRTRLADYQQAISRNTKALLKVHPSNYAIHGFTESISVEKIAELAHSEGLLCFHDWGSGSFYQFRQRGLSEYATALQELAANPDILTFSGDKLLGGIQAGILLGKTKQIQKLRKHPLYRSLRLDKVTLSLLEATLEAYLDWETLPEKNPTVALLELTREEIRQKAQTVLEQLQIPENSAWTCEIRNTESRTGGGALPELPLASAAVVLSHPQWTAQALQECLRKQTIPVIGRIQDEQVWLDFRAVLPQDLEELTANLRQVISGKEQGTRKKGKEKNEPENPES